jgi:hypothetical protein
MAKYFIQFCDFPEKEVSKEKFIEIEESCGFFSKIDGATATGYFSWDKGGVRIEGEIREDEDEEV